MKLIGLIISLLFLLSSCRTKLADNNWPENLSQGSFTTTQDLRLIDQEKVISHGYDFYLHDKTPQGGRTILLDISIPTGTEIKINDFIGISGTGTKSWYAVGEVIDQDSKAFGSTFLFFCHFGWESPNQVEVPWQSL